MEHSSCKLSNDIILKEVVRTYHERLALSSGSYFVSLKLYSIKKEDLFQDSAFFNIVSKLS